MNQRVTWAAILIPVLGLFVMVGRAEFARRSGATWQVPIAGYDPRDLLQGHYLQYQYEFSWVGVDNCSVDPDSSRQTPTPGCCLCFAANPGSPEPRVRQVDCEGSDAACDCLVRSEAVVPPLRYYVPEARARDLERAVAEGDATVELTCAPNGGVAVGALLLSGQPWQRAF